MHTSLDSALGRQRRLNQVGETITSIAAPAAAYSLRSLTGGDPLAVKVRRSGDNTEEDFTVSGINSGALVDFINTDVITEQSDFTSGVDGYDKDSHGSVAREATYEGKSDVLNYTHSGGRFGFKKTTIALDRTSSYTITFDYYADTAFNNQSWGVETSFANKTTASSNSPTVVSDAWTSVTLNVPSGRTTGISTLRLRIEDHSSGSTGDDYGTTTNGSVRIKNIVVTQLTGTGFVRTWYDQIGSNDFVQDTRDDQPKIAGNGSLLVDGNGKAEINFTKADTNLLRTTSPISFSDVLFTFRRTDSTSGTNGLLGEISTNSSPYTYIHHTSTVFSFDGNSSANPTANLGFDDQFYENQTGDKTGIVTVAQHLAHINFPSDNLGEISDIGRLYNGSAIYGTFGASELIFYPSSQLSNRVSLRTNINNYYSIF